jgi:hypothetical protein
MMSKFTKEHTDGFVLGIVLTVAGAACVVAAAGLIDCTRGEAKAAEPEPAAYTPHPYAPPTEWERSIIEAADEDCVNRHGARQAAPGQLDVVLALAWLRTERAAGLERHELGLHLAAWCREGSYLTEGWCRTERHCDRGAADGPLQMHGWARRLCWGGEDRRADVMESLRCYLSRVLVRLDEVERRCGARDVYTAQAWVASWPRYGGRCGVESQHGEIHRRWLTALEGG